MLAACGVCVRACFTQAPPVAPFPELAAKVKQFEHSRAEAETVRFNVVGEMCACASACRCCAAVVAGLC